MVVVISLLIELVSIVFEAIVAIGMVVIFTGVMFALDTLFVLFSLFALAAF